MVSAAMGTRHITDTHSQSSFCKIVPPACVLFQCSRSCGSGIQKRELHCGERDSQGGYVPSAAHQDTLRDLQHPTVSSVYCPLSHNVFKIGRKSHFWPVVSRTDTWSSPYGGAGTWLNLWWTSSRSATEVRAQSSLGSSLAEPAPALWS